MAIIAPQNLLTGQAGVYRVASELMLRGVNVSIPVVDHGADLILANGIKVQVKSTHHREQKFKQPDGSYKKSEAAYFFGLSWSKKLSKKVWVKRPHNYSSEVDYLIFWGIDEDRFWIVPAKLCDGKQSAMVCAGKHATSFASRSYGIAQHLYAGEGRWDLLTESSRPEASTSTLSLVGEAV